MEVVYRGATDRGKVRRKNEDYFIARKLGEGEYIFAVADGMGGHQAGEIASRMACEELLRQLKKKARVSPIVFFKTIFERINRKILKESISDITKAGMGSTLSVLYIKGNQAYIAHIGDSRIYWVTGNKIVQLTMDHSLVERMVREGALSLEEARSHPKRNVLYQSLGVSTDLHPQLVGPVNIKPGDKFILCSDGLYNHLQDHELKKAVQQMDPQQAVDFFISKANERGGQDNITVVVVEVPSEKAVERGKGRFISRFKEVLRRTVDLRALVFVVLLIIGVILLAAAAKKLAGDYFAKIKPKPPAGRVKGAR